VEATKMTKWRFIWK